MDAARLRTAYPTLGRVAYLNAGTFGPVSAAAEEAAAEAWRSAAQDSRAAGYIERFVALFDELRERYARLLNAPAREIALMPGTSDGCGHVIANVGLRAGDEVVTADDEHPGVTGPLIAAREQRGVKITAVPLADIPGAITEATNLVICSHVSWRSGAVAPVAAIVAAAKPYNIPVMLDGAQGVGAIPVDVAALGVDFYAGSGQKWLCGPGGTGMLWIADPWIERLEAPAPSYGGVLDPNAGLDTAMADDAKRHESPPRDLPQLAAAVAAFDVLATEGFPALQAHAIASAAHLADALRDRGHDVVERGDSTLVAWTVPGGDDEALATRERLQEDGIVVRDLPRAGRLRASVGAWNDGEDIERLLTALDAAA